MVLKSYISDPVLSVITVKAELKKGATFTV